MTNPGNPTGVVLSPEEMRLMADIAKEHGLFLISDEVYREFVYGGEPLASMAQFDDAAENVVVVDSISKRFSACGARVDAAPVSTGAGDCAAPALGRGSPPACRIG